MRLTLNPKLNKLQRFTKLVQAETSRVKKRDPHGCKASAAQAEPVADMLALELLALREHEPQVRGRKPFLYHTMQYCE